MAPSGLTPVAKPANSPGQLQPVQPRGEAAAVAESPKPPGTPRVKITFVLVDLGAKRVSLSGDFNGWSPDATPLRRDASGNWETAVHLAPGRHEYKFVVDGQWVPDPQAREQMWNLHGTLNSVIEVRA